MGFCWGCWGRGAILMGSLERSGGVLVETWGASMFDSMMFYVVLIYLIAICCVILLYLRDKEKLPWPTAQVGCLRTRLISMQCLKDLTTNFNYPVYIQ